jgi:allantoin racemase
VTPHIRIITPHVAPVPRKLAEVDDLARRFGLRISQANIAEGPRAIESRHDEALCAAGVVAAARAAEAEGVDAVIVDCFADPALDAVRETVRIPAIGPGEAGLHAAAQFARRFGIVTILDAVVPMIEDRVRLAGLSHRLAGVRVIDTPVREIDGDEARLAARLVEAAARSVLEDRADLVLLGCTGFLGIDRGVEAALRERGIAVSVLSPLRVAVMAALLALQLGLRHYPTPCSPVVG